MFYTQLAERAHDLKEMNGGNANMCQIVEELNAKAVKMNSEQTALRMIKRKKTYFGRNCRGQRSYS